MPIYKDPILIYKNFKMVKELDIAGEFIYDGITKMERIETLGSEESDVYIFSFLYNTAVGIERLQKILVILLEEIGHENIEDIEKSLITHSHQNLQKRIFEKANVILNSREQSFLQLLDNFYKTCRYDRFNVLGSRNKDKEIIEEFVIKTLGEKEGIEFFGRKTLLFSNRIKEQFGRIIGSIARKYYSAIESSASEQNIYSYELRRCSKAETIFIRPYKKKSLHEMKVNEKIALKELVVYLVNSKELGGIENVIKKVPALDFEPAFINEILSFLLKGDVADELISEVTGIYEEGIENVGNRMELLDLIGNLNIEFDND